MGRGNYNTRIGICRLSSEPVSQLRQLVGRADDLIRLENCLKNALPPAFGDHVQLASYRNDHLTLHCDNATWATRIRLTQARLLTELGQTREFKDLKRITPKIRPRRYQRQAKIKAKAISAQARNQLQETADAIEDPKLSAALRSLANR